MKISSPGHPLSQMLSLTFPAQIMGWCRNWGMFVSESFCDICSLNWENQWPFWFVEAALPQGSLVPLRGRISSQCLSCGLLCIHICPGSLLLLPSVSSISLIKGLKLGERKMAVFGLWVRFWHHLCGYFVWNFLSSLIINLTGWLWSETLCLWLRGSQPRVTNEVSVENW